MAQREGFFIKLSLNKTCYLFVVPILSNHLLPVDGDSPSRYVTNNGNDTYLRRTCLLSGRERPLYFLRKSLLSFFRFPNALVNKNQVVSEINCHMEYAG